MEVKKMKLVVFQVLLLQLSSLLAAGVSTTADANEAAIAKLNCRPSCGNINIPFPFGIGQRHCFLDDWYEIDCQNDTVPRLKKIDMEIFSLKLPHSKPSIPYKPGLLNVSFPVSYAAQKCIKGGMDALQSILSQSPFFISDSNIFVGVGCNILTTIEDTESAIVGCKSLCENDAFGSRSFRNCSAGTNGCCQTAIPINLRDFNIQLQMITSGTNQSSLDAAADPCSHASAFLVEHDWFRSNAKELSSRKHVPVQLDWGIPNNTNIGIYHEDPNFNRTSNYECMELTSGYLYCICDGTYRGNPYLVNGCQDINECDDPSLNNCHNGHCVNEPGTYRCVDPRRTLKLVFIGIAGGVGALLLLAFGGWLYKVLKTRKEMQLKKKFFKRNGGLLLQQQLDSPKGIADRSKLFNSEELNRATDCFSENRVLGRGGQGTVYKGILIDGRIVAIKKPCKVLHFDEDNVEQFINEVFILSHINHRNVVKLLGCCLESEFPLLVYEFIPNGTLFRYLHDPCDDPPFTWDARLRIATEVAGALSYLHSAASIPIYHRDIKTSNILLDEKYQAKVADFGASRSVSVDQSHVTTLVQGSFGYLDPEFFQSGQFTDKSDVYSFGVVLVELLTRQKPASSARVNGGMGLATHFIISMEENCLFDIIDAEVSSPENKEEIVAVADLARRCLKLSGRNRPTMNQVSMELSGIRNSKAQQQYHLSIIQQQNDEESDDELEELVEDYTGISSRRSKSDTEVISVILDTYPLLLRTNTIH